MMGKKLKYKLEQDKGRRRGGLVSFSAGRGVVCSSQLRNMGQALFATNFTIRFELIFSNTPKPQCQTWDDSVF